MGKEIRTIGVSRSGRIISASRRRYYRYSPRQRASRERNARIEEQRREAEARRKAEILQAKTKLVKLLGTSITSLSKKRYAKRFENVRRERIKDLKFKRVKIQKLSADNFIDNYKRILNSKGSTPKPIVRLARPRPTRIRK